MNRWIINFFSSGRWIFALLGVLTAGLLVKDVLIPLGNGGFTRVVGDGKHVSSYGFDLSDCRAPPGDIAPSGNPKDGLAALTHPALLTIRQVSKINKARRDSGGFIENPDRVIGVVIHGQARAYPIPIMNWHAVVNDTLGGEPIAVTYDGYCESVLIYSRRVAGQVLRFGYSGLVLDSNTLLYDRKPKVKQESLWSQITGRAIAGPAAARRYRLTPLPCQVLPWGQWKQMHPRTTMIAGITGLYSAYDKDPYGAYYASGGLPPFPVHPLWRNPHYGLKSRLILVQMGRRWRPLALRKLFSAAGTNGLVRVRVAGRTLLFECWRGPQWRTAALLSPANIPVAYSLLFAWYAQHPRSYHWRAESRAIPEKIQRARERPAEAQAH